MGVEPTTRKRRRRRVSASPPRVSAKQAAESVVAAANAQRDVLRLVPERLRRLEGAELVGYRVSTMPESLRRWAFDLTKRNMFDAYERTWGWNNREKRRELAHADARFLVAHVRENRKKAAEEREKDERDDHDERDDRDASSSALAFAHVRFEVEADEKPVVYAYELQCDGLKDAMRKGYGRFLMRAAEAAGATAGCTRIVLTVLKENAGARFFYEAMGYETDPATPTEASCVYVILRKEVKRGSRALT
jgi:GNAT superfamily N-acetyltransferase